MAASSSTLPPLSPAPFPQVHRTDSLGSNVSAGSVTSLSRRPRTKSRPRAVTVSSRRDRSPASARDLDAPVATTDELLASTSHTPPSTVSPNPSPLPLPSRPARSPYVPHPYRKTTSPPDIVPVGGWKAMDDMESSWRSRAMKIEHSTPHRRKRGSSVPRDAFRLSMLSSSSSAQTSAFFTTVGQMQTVPHFSSLRDARQRLRESNVTVRSGTASSVYPLTSSTDHHISSVDPDETYDDYQTFHTDDVSFASPVVTPNKKAAKSAAPTFLDLFRVGKARSKPTTPPSPLTPEIGPPRLRTTADSTITSSRAPTAHVDPLPHRPIVPILVPHASRVAVVREKVDDLVLAAEQAEQELKMRVDAKQQSTQHYDNYVDPTDAVDLPPPSENSPFAFQASELRGLGVENSVGAAVLAERLPPGTPGVWSLDPDEEAWRKALLQEAVGHSLNNTPEHSFHTSLHTTTPSSGSMGPSFAQSSPSPVPRLSSNPSMKRNLGQRIVNILEEQHESILLQPSSPSEEAHLVSQSQMRDRTPSTASHAIPVKLPRDSVITVSPADSRRVSQNSTSPSVLRKTSSSPMLHFWHDGATQRSRNVVSMTPPLPRGRASSVVTSDSMTSGSHYSVQEEAESIDHSVGPEPPNSRPSFSSLPSRPSVSEYSQISPTVSAFNDGHFGSAVSIIENMVQEDDSDVGDLVSFDDDESTRYISPPPRASSSLAIHSLHPPPRFPSSTLAMAHRPLLTPRPSVTSSDPDDGSERPSAYATAVELDTIALQPNQPFYPLGHHVFNAQDLSSLSVSSSIHNAPPPASPLEFFDQIEGIEGDDWESSDESDEDAGDSEYVEAVGRPTPHGSSQGHSTTSLASRTASTQPVSATTSREDVSMHSAHSGSSERVPVVNVPRPPIYFKDTKSDHALSSYDLLQLSRSAAASSSLAPSDTQGRGGTGEEKKKDGRTASMQRLDGLVLQHIEAERGTLSRIAKTVKDAKP
ncbi:hypothetical protein BJV77DRAFT_993107 [Russula vinacea]|nr:hypothetical protein BJV77DRAFT_993107 [Russula vinacea]